MSDHQTLLPRTEYVQYMTSLTTFTCSKQSSFCSYSEKDSTSTELFALVIEINISTDSLVYIQRCKLQSPTCKDRFTIFVQIQNLLTSMSFIMLKRMCVYPFNQKHN